MAKMGDLIGGWRLECGCIHNLLTIEAGSHESTHCPLHAAAPRMRALLEEIAVPDMFPEWEAERRALLREIKEAS